MRATANAHTLPEGLHRVPFDEAGIALWQVDLDRSPAADAEALCSAAERERAQRYATPTLRRRYLTARAALRCVLGQWLQCPPATLEIESDELGKPRLRAGAFTAEPHFNLSHSEHLGLIAMRQEGPVGVDIEIVRPLQDVAGLALRHFSASEHRAWAAAKAPEVFFRVWTRKEACLKALGTGLLIDPRQVDVGAASVQFPAELGGCAVEVRSIACDPAAAAAVAWADEPSVQRARAAAGL